MEDDSIKVSATCVRIPVMSGHSESVYIETEKTATVAEIQELIAKAPGAVLEDDPSQQIYPQALNSVGKKKLLWVEFVKIQTRKKESTFGLFQITY